MLFYDFEVFKEDWLVVILDMLNKERHVCVNNPDYLKQIYEEHHNDIWCGFNSNHYDQYILKGILLGMNPKTINDKIIQDDIPGWRISSQFKTIKLNSYDVMLNGDKGLKWMEGSMGHNIKESDVDFKIDRKLTEAELDETVEYCINDVEETVDVFLKRKEEFEGRLDLVKLYCEGKPLNLSLLEKTKPQLTALILDAHKKTYDDEFDIDFPSTHKVKKYQKVLDWYKNPDNRKYYIHVPGKKTPEKNKLDITVAGCPHTFAWGGVHGALEKYIGEGYYINMDVASLYPSLMIQYNLFSRNISDPAKFVEIYHTRLKLKKEKNPLQKVLKIVLNSTYGVLKDRKNSLYDPLMSNKVCVYGQILLLDLIEHLEPYSQIIQSNTDGVLVKMPNGWDEDEWFKKIDDIAYEWEKRTRLNLEFDEYRKVYQKDVNNYIVVAPDGSYKAKGSYVKKLNDLDYGDFPIVNHALVNYMVNGIDIETTIMNCNDLREFQYIAKISDKYECILHGDKKLNERCIRVFASIDDRDAGVKKISKRTGKAEKISNSPEHCFIENGDVNGMKIPSKLDRQWYINLANKRLNDFGMR